MLPLFAEARAHAGLVEQRTHRQFDPQRAFQAEAGVEVGQRRQACAAAHGGWDVVVAEFTHDGLGLRDQPRVVERLIPARDQRAGTRDQAVIGPGDGLERRQRGRHRVDRVLKTAVVVVGDADELKQRGPGDQPALRLALRVEHGQCRAQFGTAGAKVIQRQVEAALQLLPARVRIACGRIDRQLWRAAEPGCGSCCGSSMGTHRNLG